MDGDGDWRVGGLMLDRRTLVTVDGRDRGAIGSIVHDDGGAGECRHSAFDAYGCITQITLSSDFQVGVGMGEFRFDLISNKRGQLKR